MSWKTIIATTSQFTMKTPTKISSQSHWIRTSMQRSSGICSALATTITVEHLAAHRRMVRVQISLPSWHTDTEQMK